MIARALALAVFCCFAAGPAGAQTDNQYQLVMVSYFGGGQFNGKDLGSGGVASTTLGIFKTQTECESAGKNATIVDKEITTAPSRKYGIFFVCVKAGTK